MRCEPAWAASASGASPRRGSSSVSGPGSSSATSPGGRCPASPYRSTSAGSATQMASGFCPARRLEEKMAATPDSLAAQVARP